ncbi:DUF3000 domain-containing protein [Schaalia sp. lx-260]|uniref:DUF3000 domain-containing protein n=1 Tax=Schaalia sp. lx-260 TaxID=2899082 RepID=UPI001E28886A|nr:DUF3000 domain-containing protein [Schaalia sp. lx-260]
MSETAVPADFVTALLSVRDAAQHPLMEYEEIPAPTRLAPWNAALTLRTREENYAQPRSTGRFVILHDPHTQPGWNGTFRVVAHMRSQIDAEMCNDPLLSEAIWHWAHDCLEEAGAGYHDITGTVTREISESFGGLDLRGATLHVELRASWTPYTAYLGEHLSAWSELMCRTAGITAAQHIIGVPLS